MKSISIANRQTLVHKLILSSLLIILLAAACSPASPTPLAPTSLSPTNVPPTSPSLTNVPPTSPSLTPMPTVPGNPQMAVSQLARITSPQVPQSDQEALSAGNRAFAAGLYQQLRTGSSNLIFSPYSISLALAMTFGGAKGDTATQMASALHFALPSQQLHPAFNALDQHLASLGQAAAGQSTPSPDEKGSAFQLSIANATWGQKDFTFLPAYLDLLAQNYGAGMHLADFAGNAEAVRQSINDWVSQQTQAKIKDLFPSGTLDSSTRLALVNAIYFKASWLHPFDPASTQTGVFHLKDGTQVSVPMMVSGDTATSYFRGANYQAVELPYLGEQVSMVILLPNEGQWDAFESGLNAAGLDAAFQGLKSSEVNLTMPKFKIESSFDMLKTLSDMGMPDAFNPSQADFSGMDGRKDLFISAVFHKAYVNVDEQGTEAAAATGVAMSLTAVLGTPPTVVLDRPFLFFIYNRDTSTVLFAGRVLDPSK